MMSEWNSDMNAAPRGDRDVSYETPFKFRAGPAVAYDDETGEPLYLVWFDYLGGGMSETSHWMPLPLPPADRENAP